MILLSHRIYINRKEQRHLALLPKHIPPVKPMKLYIFLNRLSNFGIKTYTRVAKIVEFPPYTSYPVSVSPNVILSHYCGTLSKPKIKTAPVRLCEPKSRLYFNLTSFSIHAPSDPWPHLGNHTTVGMSPSILWPVTVSVFLRFSCPFQFWGFLVKCFVECLSVGVCLMLLFWGYGFGERIPGKWSASSSHDIHLIYS